MPPPRLTQPLRPWHPPTTSAYARRASNGRQDRKRGERGECDGDGPKPEPPAMEGNNDNAHKPSSRAQDAPAAGWWGSLVSRVSLIFEKPPQTPASSHERPILASVPQPDTNTNPEDKVWRRQKSKRPAGYQHPPDKKQSADSKNSSAAHESTGAVKAHYVSKNPEKSAISTPRPEKSRTKTVIKNQPERRSFDPIVSESNGEGQTGRTRSATLDIANKRSAEPALGNKKRSASIAGKLPNPVDSSLPEKDESASIQVTPSPERKVPTLEYKQLSSEKRYSPASVPEPEWTNADLGFKLQQLLNQVNILQEKVMSLPALDTNETQSLNGVQATNTQTAKESKSSSKATNTRTAKESKSSLKASASTVPVKQPRDAPAPLVSTRQSKDVRAQSPPTVLSLLLDNDRRNSSPARRYKLKLQARLQNGKKEMVRDNDQVASPYSDSTTESHVDGQRLIGQVHPHARLMKSADDLNMDNDPRSLAVENPVAKAVSPSAPSPVPSIDAEADLQSLLGELFPEVSTYTQPHYTTRNPYPKLDPPSYMPLVRAVDMPAPQSAREKYIEAFQRSTEKMTILQLLHCSTELTEADFRRLTPKGEHIDTWARDGDIDKIIPGRDPLSLERLPFYYLVFKNPDAALRYQSNASRLHKLSRLHAPNSSTLAVPPPRGVTENGENVHAALASYQLAPTSQDLFLHVLMQPYNSALSLVIEQGGYHPIVPSSTSAGSPIHKVLLHIEGYEPAPYDLWQLFTQDAHRRGLAWPFLHEHRSVQRLRDLVDLKARFLPVSSANPRAAETRTDASSPSYDPFAAFLEYNTDKHDSKYINQTIMNRVYNRWIVDFSEEEPARRFARLWHRKVLPAKDSVKRRTRGAVQEVRTCNAEYLW